MLACPVAILLSVAFNTNDPSTHYTNISANSCPSARGFVPTQVYVRTKNMQQLKPAQCVKITFFGGGSSSYNIGSVSLQSSYPPTVQSENQQAMVNSMEQFNSITPLNRIAWQAQKCNPDSGQDTSGVVELLGYGTGTPGLQPQN